MFDLSIWTFYLAGIYLADNVISEISNNDRDKTESTCMILFCLLKPRNTHNLYGHVLTRSCKFLCEVRKNIYIFFFSFIF